MGYYCILNGRANYWMIPGHWMITTLINNMKIAFNVWTTKKTCKNQLIKNPSMENLSELSDNECDEGHVDAGDCGNKGADEDSSPSG